MLRLKILFVVDNIFPKENIKARRTTISVFTSYVGYEFQH